MGDGLFYAYRWLLVTFKRGITLGQINIIFGYHCGQFLSSLLPRVFRKGGVVDR